MDILLTTFAVQNQAPSGLGLLGINLQAFIFQLITFALVLILLRKYVYTRLIATLEDRRSAVIESLDNAKKAAQDLEKTAEKTAELMEQAKKEASEIVSLAQKEAAIVVDEAETKAKKRADHLIETAESRLSQDIIAVRKELRGEMLGLISAATEKILRQKLDTATDKKLIADALKDMK